MKQSQRKRAITMNYCFNKENCWNIFKNVFICVLLLLCFGSSWACTEFQIGQKNQVFVGRNFDFQTKYATVVINPRGTLNNTRDLLHKGNPLQWVSKYGSVTVDLADKSGKIYLPAVMSGINEYGLSASTLWLTKSEFPVHPAKATLPTSLWPKYFLDNAKTVKEAIQLAKKIDVEPNVYKDRGAVNLHLFVHDARGNAALMEYLHGKLVIYHEKDLPILAITNNPYQESLQYSKQFKGYSCHASFADEADSLLRFAKIVYFLKIVPPFESKQQAIAYVFQGLGYVASPFSKQADSQTVWSVVFDLADRILYFRNIDNQQIRIIRLKKFNFSKSQPTKVLSVNNDLSGYVENKFSALSDSVN